MLIVIHSIEQKKKMKISFSILVATYGVELVSRSLIHSHCVPLKAPQAFALDEVKDLARCLWLKTNTKTLYMAIDLNVLMTDTLDITTLTQQF